MDFYDLPGFDQDLFELDPGYAQRSTKNTINPGILNTQDTVQVGPRPQIVGPSPNVASAMTADPNKRKLAAIQEEIDKLGAKDPQYQTFLNTRDALNKEIYTPTADLSQFEGLLGKLEASKMKQAGSAALDTRRNTYAQGLAQMMANF